MNMQKKITAFLLCILLVISFSLPSYAMEVIAGGMPFGIKVSCEGIYIVGIGDVNVAGKKLSPARDAGLFAGDIITDIDNVPVRDVETLQKAIRESNGKNITLTVKRADSQFHVSLSPTQADDGHYRTGMWIRDSIAGIGTVSFIDPKTGTFAGLGHGISHAENGELVNMVRGIVCNVTIEGVVRGEAGTPGELKGVFRPGKIGTLLGNTNSGVWGVFAELPPCSDCIVPTAAPEEVTEGEAELLCTTDSGGIGHYKVYLTNIDREGKPTKNFIVTVTDDALIAKTGGIVQGMSGSPIIQNGKLVGAVTHVLINDPKRGYGIFIENMLELIA